MTTAADIRPATDAKSGTGLRRPMVARRRSEALMAYGFLAPQLIGLAVFMVGPLSNFAWVFTDPQMLQSMRNTLWLTVLQVPGLPVSGFLAAFFLQKAGRMKCVYRVAFFAPQVTSSIAVSAIWLWLLNPELSPLTTVFEWLGITPPDWLHNPVTAIPLLVFVTVWQGIGYQIVMFMAGLESAPNALFEAADIDGASEWQKMRKITIPMLSPTVPQNTRTIAQNKVAGAARPNVRTDGWAEKAEAPRGEMAPRRPRPCQQRAKT